MEDIFTGRVRESPNSFLHGVCGSQEDISGGARGKHGEEETARDKAGKSPGDYAAIEAFDLFRNYLDSQLKDFKKDLSVATKKKDSVKLKKESNKVQYEFNSDILYDLEVVKEQVKNKEISKIIQGSIDKLKHRNKLIQVADSSPGGWLTVSEYEKPILGSDSDDERRLKQAESRAVKKLKPVSTATSKHANLYNPYRSSFFRGNVETPRTADTGRGGFNTGSYGQKSFRGPRKATQNDICFQCGFRGHFRRDCRSSTGFTGAKSEAYTTDRPAGSYNGTEKNK